MDDKELNLVAAGIGAWAQTGFLMTRLMDKGVLSLAEGKEVITDALYSIEKIERAEPHAVWRRVRLLLEQELKNLPPS